MKNSKLGLNPHGGGLAPTACPEFVQRRGARPHVRLQACAAQTAAAAAAAMRCPSPRQALLALALLGLLALSSEIHAIHQLHGSLRTLPFVRPTGAIGRQLHPCAAEPWGGPPPPKSRLSQAPGPRPKSHAPVSLSLGQPVDASGPSDEELRQRPGAASLSAGVLATDHPWGRYGSTCTDLGSECTDIGRLRLELREFSARWKLRPRELARNNRGGMRFPHQFAVWYDRFTSPLRNERMLKGKFLQD